MRTDLIAPQADLLTALRSATAPAHERLDAAFGRLDLSRADEQARFLAAHAIGLAPLFAIVNRFARQELSAAFPDYPAMLRADLAAFGIDDADLPALSPPEDETPGLAAGACYVIAGSRLGMTVIRRAGYWGSAHGQPSRYMEDDGGHAVWKALVPWLRAQSAESAESETSRMAALAGFDTFARAFALSDGVSPAGKSGARG